jgi:hypothetical protein
MDLVSKGYGNHEERIWNKGVISGKDLHELVISIKLTRTMIGLSASLDFQHPCFTQIHGTYCGPAVVQMLLSALGIEVTQPMVVEAAGVYGSIESCGMRVDQLAWAVVHLAPQARFWVKGQANMDDLVALVDRWQCPVGVEWQGQVSGDQSFASHSPDTDGGHYSVVSRIDPLLKRLVIADPFQHHLSRKRIFSFEEFEARWWDFNEIPDPYTGLARLVEDDHLMFIITPHSETFPRELGMEPGNPSCAS